MAAQGPEPLHTGDAIFLRPGDIDQIIKFAMVWVCSHPDDAHGSALIDEVAAGSKGIVMHFDPAANHPSRG